MKNKKEKIELTGTYSLSRCENCGDFFTPGLFKLHKCKVKPTSSCKCCCSLGEHGHIGSACTTCKHCKKWKDKWYKKEGLKNFQPIFECQPTEKPKLTSLPYEDNTEKHDTKLCPKCNPLFTEKPMDWEAKYALLMFRYNTAKTIKQTTRAWNNMKSFIKDLLKEQEREFYLESVDDDLEIEITLAKNQAIAEYKQKLIKRITKMKKEIFKKGRTTYTNPERIILEDQVLILDEVEAVIKE